MAPVPESIGKYRITQLIAQGGMGAVYKAVHPTLKRNVIIKKLTAKGGPQFIERFKREARIMMDFKHEGIVQVYDHFKEGSSYYLILEYVDGFSLDELIRRRRSIPDVLGLYIFYQVCKALKYAHDSGVIHRDMKPSNILISKKGEVKLVDFGIAGYEDEDEGEEGLTTPGMTLGTLAYMPPEQFKDTRNVDLRADIYAMGVMLYEIATGKKPFPGNFSPDTIVAIRKGKYLHVRKLNPRIDRVFALLIGKMIRAKKERRYQDLSPVIRILRRRLKREDREELQKRLVAMMNSLEYKAPASGRLRPGRALAAILVALALCSAGGAWLYLGGKYFEWLRPAEYGKLEIEAKFGPGERAREHRVSALLIPQGPGPSLGASAPRMPGLLPALKGALGLGPGGGLVSSGRLYLKSGEYLLQLSIGEKLYSEAFYLPPFKKQEAEGRSRGALLSYEYAGHLPRPLTLGYKVLDSRMRRDITDIATVSVRSSFGYWFAPSELPRNELVSGKRYDLRISAPGFESEELSVPVGILQTQVLFQASLMPIEARLSLVSAIKGIRVAIDGMDSLPSGDASHRPQPLRLAESEPLVLSLSPGRIRIEARAGARGGSEDFSLKPGEARNLIIRAGPGKAELVFEELQ